jgi:hypothetical protein
LLLHHEGLVVDGFIPGVEIDRFAEISDVNISLQVKVDFRVIWYKHIGAVLAGDFGHAIISCCEGATHNAQDYELTDFWFDQLVLNLVENSIENVG